MFPPPVITLHLDQPSYQPGQEMTATVSLTQQPGDPVVWVSTVDTVVIWSQVSFSGERAVFTAVAPGRSFNVWWQAITASGQIAEVTGPVTVARQHPHAAQAA